MAANYKRSHSCPGADRRKRGGQSDGPSDHRPDIHSHSYEAVRVQCLGPRRTGTEWDLIGQALGHWTTRCYDKLATRSDPDNEAVSLVERTASQDKATTSTADARSADQRNVSVPVHSTAILQKRIRAARGQRNIAGGRFVLLSLEKFGELK